MSDSSDDDYAVRENRAVIHAAKATLQPGRAPLKPEEKVWVAGTLCLILFLVVSSQGIMIPYFLYELPLRIEDALWPMLKVLGPFNVGAFGILYNYYKCVTLDPGQVPQGWKPPDKIFELSYQDDEQDDAQSVDDETEEDLKRKEQANVLFQIRYCKRCKAFKPPRAHHCKTCKRCVLRMDHHCPWIANCVGHRNYPYFIRFLVFVDLTCTMHLLMLSARVADWWWMRMTGGFWRSPSTAVMVWLLLNFIFCGLTLMIVGAFSIFHFWSMCANTTTIEGSEMEKVDRMIRRGRIPQVDYPFDLGVWRNVKSVFGGRLLRGDGLVYDVGSGMDKESQYFWPYGGNMHNLS